MRRGILAWAAAAAILALGLTGCTATPEPRPTKTSAASSPTPSPTPTEEPIVAPEAAFDLDCDDVATAMSGLVGETGARVSSRLPETSNPNWYPGPAQYMMQRANGIACSSEGAEIQWDVVVLPDADLIIDGIVDRGYEVSTGTRCEQTYGCSTTIVRDDVLVTARAASPSTTADGSRMEEVIEGLLSAAVESRRDVPYIASDLAGVACERLLTPEELQERLDAPVVLVDPASLGGWDIPAEVYNARNDSRMCMYSTGTDIYWSTTHLTITMLPAGAWAFEEMGGEPAVVTGADEAKTSTDVHGNAALDVRVGLDWLRVTTYESGDSAADAVALAEMIVEHFTLGRPAPQ